MSAEGKPQSDSALLARPLQGITALVLRFPKFTLLAALGFAVAAVVFTFMRLSFHTSRLDLLNPRSEYNQLWIKFIEEFGDEDDIVVVVEGDRREEIIPVLDEIAEGVSYHPELFRCLLHKIDLDELRRKGLYYLSLEELQQVEGFLNETGPVLRGEWAGLSLGNLLGSFAGARERPSGQRTPEEDLQRLLASLQTALADPDQYRSPWQKSSHSVEALRDKSPHYFLTGDDHLGILLLRIGSQDQSFVQSGTAIRRLRPLLKEIDNKYPGINIGLTGLPVMESDEMAASQVAMTEASLLSLLGVSLLFIAGFGGVRHPLFTVATLLIGMAWAFGYVTLAVGHLNILSVSFAVILIGLGIDFGIHYAARYLQYRSRGENRNAAVIATAGSIGPGIATGVFTTAIAFFTAGVTEFTGVAELGVIAGGGILLCGLASILVLPAMLRLGDPLVSQERFAEPLPIQRWIAPTFRWPRTTLVCSLGLTVLVAQGIPKVWYDHNLLNLQPSDLESVVWEQRLLNETDQSVWYALSIADTREELLTRNARFLKLESVERTEEIVSLVPLERNRKQPIIRRIHERLAHLPERPPLIPIDPPHVVRGRLSGLAQALARGGGSEATIARLQSIQQRLATTPLNQYYALVSRYQQNLATDLWQRLDLLKEVSYPEMPVLDDLPQSLVDRFVGKNGKHLLKIYAKGDIWDMENLSRFVHDVRSIDPEATGKPLQTFEASRQMKNCYQEAAAYALIAICLILLLDFRSPKQTLLALLPLALATVQLFGILGLAGIPLNPANIIVLPLILGIGVDDGVHILHDYRAQSGPYRMSMSTANSVLLTSLTTMVGFGSLMIANHQGIQSLGRVLVIGVTCCCFTSLIMLPALLAWLSRSRCESDESELASPAESPAAFESDGAAEHTAA